MSDLIATLDQAVADKKITEQTHENIKKWLNNPQLSEFHSEINDLINQENWQELNDAFFTQIEFGTAGIRGKTGLGSARINRWTVGTAAQGLADYIKSQGQAAINRGVIIGSDTRLTSPQFVQLVSDILTTNGLQVYRFDRPPQVGMFSFGLRHYKAQAGIYISASHNPPADNGVKIYWQDGAQVLPPHDKAITDAVKAVTEIQSQTPNNALITTVGDDFDTLYRMRVLQESVYSGRSAKVIYSPFHGTGQYGLLPILQEAGFQVTTIDEQMTPDGNFPNVPGGTPNPEYPEANQLMAQKVLESKADLGMSTDPDADRIGVVIPKGDQTVILSGNDVATLLTYFICQRLKEDDKLPSNGFLVRTVVTTPIMDAMAEDFGLTMYPVPVGFKYFGSLMDQHEDFGNQLYIYGAEESFGSLKGSYSHDKDASSVALIMAELVSWLKDRNQTVWEYFEEIHRRYGLYYQDLINIRYEGAAGFEAMNQMMSDLRQNPPSQIGQWPVVKVVDGLTEPFSGFSANTLIFYLSDDEKSFVIIRPSGTEPKAKLYICLYSDRTKAEDLELVKIQVKEEAEALKAAAIALTKQE